MGTLPDTPEGRSCMSVAKVDRDSERRSLHWIIQKTTQRTPGLAVTGPVLQPEKASGKRLGVEGGGECG